MALRAFQCNPSIGGFGGESHLISSRYRIREERRNKARNSSGDGTVGRAARTARAEVESIEDTNGGQTGTESGDAFAQIVKELVDNAVDACAVAKINGDSKGHDGAEKKGTKRVRVDITPATVLVSANANDGDSSCDSGEKTKSMDCLRVVISDNGCGMENIDYCVTAFRSNKVGAGRQSKDGGKGRTRGDEIDRVELTRPTGNDKADGGVCRNFTPSEGACESYTSGRYGVGLTLCLLHAQRLVPGTGACIASATANATEWTRATYEPDTDADSIVCKKKEHIPKEVDDECGTTISLLVPALQSEIAWPRLAEYFARFQLSVDLQCSLEVKAPTLQSMPLYIRPPAEIERRMERKTMKSLEPHPSVDVKDANDANGDSDESGNKRSWEGGDCFDEGNSLGVEMNRQRTKTSKAARRRAEAEAQKKKRLSLIHRAASVYGGRPDLRVENVAHATQPIRRGVGPCRLSAPSESGPVLEVSLVVFGPRRCAGDKLEGICPQNEENDLYDDSCSKLQVVRMVNGIPLLDSPEAIACGLVQKIASNAAAWNSFGLSVSQQTGTNMGRAPSRARNTPTFEVDDSSQVAPFLKTTAHSMFREIQGHDQLSSDDDDDFDIENLRGKRKKVHKVKSILPAASRLGDILMIVQIRAKPSALPLPTLSKGRPPLNKGIADALENGITFCLRCLQRSSPGLLLTAHQLKRVERDVKFIPSVACAMASVLCSSRRRTICDDTLNIASSWQDEAKKKGLSCNHEKRTQWQGQVEPSERSNGATKNWPNEERMRVNMLSLKLQMRLRLVVSDEFKEAKKAQEREKQRVGRKKLAAAKKRAKNNRAAESDTMKSDCFDSDDGGNCRHLIAAQSSRFRSCKMMATRDKLHHDFDSEAISPIVQNAHSHCGGGSTGSSEQSSIGNSRRICKKSCLSDFNSEKRSPSAQNKQRHGKGEPICSSSGHSGSESWLPLKSSWDDFDGKASIPIARPRICCLRGASLLSSGVSGLWGSQRSPKKVSCNDIDRNTSSPVVCNSLNEGTAKGHRNSTEAASPEVTKGSIPDDFESEMSSSTAPNSCRSWKEEFDGDSGYHHATNLQEKTDAGHTEHSPWNENIEDALDDGYHLKDDRSDVHVQQHKIPRDRRQADALPCDELNLPASSSCKCLKAHSDVMSSDSEWSDQYGQVVPGHLFQ